MQTVDTPRSEARPSRLVITQAMQERVIAVYREGDKTVPQIAGLMDLSSAQVSRILTKAGAWRSRNQAAARDVGVDRVIADYQSGLAVKKVCDTHGITSGTLYAILGSNNVPVRHRSRRVFGRSQKITIVMDHADGVGVDDLAARYGCTRDDILAVVEAA